MNLLQKFRQFDILLQKRYNPMFYMIPIVLRIVITMILDYSFRNNVIYICFCNDI